MHLFRQYATLFAVKVNSMTILLQTLLTDQNEANCLKAKAVFWYFMIVSTGADPKSYIIKLCNNKLSQQNNPYKSNLTRREVRLYIISRPFLWIIIITVYIASILGCQYSRPMRGKTFINSCKAWLVLRQNFHQFKRICSGHITP